MHDSKAVSNRFPYSECSCNYVSLTHSVFFWPTPASFFIFGLFKQTIQFLQQMNVKNVKSIQYPAPGFEPTTFGM